MTSEQISHANAFTSTLGTFGTCFTLATTLAAGFLAVFVWAFDVIPLLRARDLTGGGTSLVMRFLCGSSLVFFDAAAAGRLILAERRFLALASSSSLSLMMSYETDNSFG